MKMTKNPLAGLLATLGLVLGRQHAASEPGLPQFYGQHYAKPERRAKRVAVRRIGRRQERRGRCAGYAAKFERAALAIERGD